MNGLDVRQERPTTDTTPDDPARPSSRGLRIVDGRPGTSAPPAVRRPLNLPLPRRLSPEGPPLTEAQLWYAYSRSDREDAR